MKNFVIGIAGKVNSEKDTIASIVNYIFAVGHHKANYQEWITKRKSFDNINKDRIIHFADSLKDALSIIYNIARKYFDDREYKDNMWYCINTEKFFTNKEVENNKNVIKVVNITDNDNKLSFIIENFQDKFICIRLRQLMQLFGDNICRNNLDKNIWIKSAICKIINKAESRRVCIIPDVRYKNESNAIRYINNNSLYGVVIKVNRNIELNVFTDLHKSEQLDIEYDYIIENNDKLFNLFYKVLNIIKEIILK